MAKCKKLILWQHKESFRRLRVDDVHSHFEHSKKMGAGILSAVEEGGAGTRYRVEDLEGQRWMFMQK